MKTITLLFCLLIASMIIHTEEVASSCLNSNEIQTYIRESFNILNPICQGSLTCMVNQAICEIVDVEGYDIDYYEVSYISGDACVNRLVDVEVESTCTFDASYIEAVILNNIFCLDSEIEWIITPHYVSGASCTPITVVVSRHIIWSVRVLTYIEDLEDEAPLFTYPVSNESGNSFYIKKLRLDDPSPMFMSNLSVEELEDALAKLIYLNSLMTHVEPPASFNITTISTIDDLNQLIQEIEALIFPVVVHFPTNEEMEAIWGNLPNNNSEESDLGAGDDYHDNGITDIDPDDLGGLGGMPLPLNPFKQEGTRYLPSLNSSIYPNPVQNKCIIQYNLPRASAVSLSIYDASGQKVWTSQMVHQVAGEHVWDLTIDLPQGVYTYHLQTEEAETYDRIIKIN